MHHTMMQQQQQQQQEIEDMSSQDLAELFDQKISLSGQTYENSSRITETVPAEIQVLVPPINYSVSQHYTHSAHVLQAAKAHQPTDASSNTVPSSGLSIYQTLTQHNIPPSSLHRSQLTLFEQADNDQRRRLIQLWSISPPNYASHGGQELAGGLGVYGNAALRQAEDQALLSYQQRFFADHQANGPHEQESTCSVISGLNHSTAEIYMTSGYERLAQRDYLDQQQKMGLESIPASIGLILSTQYSQDTDPICQPKDWQPNEFMLEPMEHQYGMFEQINQFQAQAQNVVHIHEPEDEEML